MAHPGSCFGLDDGHSHLLEAGGEVANGDFPVETVNMMRRFWCWSGRGWRLECNIGVARLSCTYMATGRSIP